MRENLRIVNYLDLKLIAAEPAATADWIVRQAFATDRGTLIAHINASNYYSLVRRPAIRDRLVRDGVLLLDGIGLKIGGFILGHSHLPDLNGTDLFPLVMERIRHRDLRLFLLGGRREVAERAASSIGRRYPKAHVVGFHTGYFGSKEESHIVDEIRKHRPHALLVGLGFLRQEEFALRYLDELEVPLIWTVGGLFDFLSGAKPRAPRLLRKCRLEWLFRLLLEPRRMWHRYLVAAPWFLGHAVRMRWKKGRQPALATEEPSALQELLRGGTRSR